MNNLEEKRSAMIAMIEDWRSSGKSKKQYCLEKGINAAKFYYWYSRSKETESTPGVFIPIEKRSGTREIEVFYPNGVKLKVDGDLLLLSQLIHLY
ncbi:IS66 family insertion sequence element accessory protein TnpA [Pedobacter sp.]|uniref:IS66 family insertion sequence element accessory protein TnpA n=1 Tax=Pedobacter sp. TaxID=1411316 RepID=UPI003D7FE73E